MVLVHGGGGTAFAEWVRLWVGRGYAAIAMDPCGCVPKASTVTGNGMRWAVRRAGALLTKWTIRSRIQWTYHAVADIILAHSLIRVGFRSGP
jgi:hypothetical protein